MVDEITYKNGTERISVNGKRIFPGQTITRGEIPDDAFDALVEHGGFKDIEAPTIELDEPVKKTTHKRNK